MLGFAPLGGAPYGAAYDFGGEPLLDIIVEEEVGISRSLFPSAKWSRTATDGVAFLNPTPIFGYLYPVSAADGFLVFNIAAGFKGYFREMSDNFRVTDAIDVARFLAMSLADGIRFSNTTEVSRGVSALVAETLEIADLLEVIYGIVIRERLRVADPHIINWIANVDAADLVTLAETLRQTLPVEVVEGLEISLDELVQRAIHILERARIVDQLRGAATYNVTVAQALRLRDSLGQFFGADVEEGLAIAAQMSARALASALVGEQLEIAADLVPQLLLAVTVPEGLAIDAIDAVNMLFTPTVLEGVEITAGYVSPGGTFTAWSMNTRTAAVTEYRDFVFNSFARMGNRYLGASDDGLFELLGDDDDGEDIIARIRSGFMQFGGTQLSRLKAAYIAARGEGELLLKVIEADGREYLYAADVRNMNNAKVWMGKGQKARYFAFELTTSGQDLDLDTVEFVPIVVPRRV